ncbi:glycosyltransferase family 4 protein [Geobacillus jurassicus]|uniref:Glycosyltransferase family 4 protein n=1 Tax=Geobacillus jurassicus TaxID=235932 RepID=A0ABV6GPV7_9BACL|nr:glycosyltransferase family 4 protein [Geobacillus jurassicus]
MKQHLLNEILLAGFKFSHHSPSSGYHQLARFINSDYIDASKFPFGDAPLGSKLKQINFMLFELYLMNKTKKYKVVHYLYPEQHLIFSVPSNTKTVSVATIHLDEEWLDAKSNTNRKLATFRRKAFSQLTGIISLSSDQASRLRDIYPNKNIKFIPHGVNELGFYSHVDLHRQNFVITVIGSNYRDKKTFFEIVKYAQENHSNWRFNLIGVSKDWKEDASRFSNTIIHPFLQEDEYFKVLQSSHVHLLPVEFATANNALLEAHALGVPSVVSNNSGVLDYSLKSTFHFNNVKEAIEILNYISLLPSNEYQSLRLVTKKEASKFYWSTVAKEVLKFYKDLGAEI